MIVEWLAAVTFGFAMRFGQVFLESALTLLVGVVTAGVFRRMLGPEGTCRLFGRGWRGLLRGWSAGMLLPVCSLGVIPVAREMRRAGVPGGTVLSFVLAAPLLNPISFLYGLTLAEPVVIGCFAVASLAVSTLAGSAWDRLFESHSSQQVMPVEKPPAVGLRRLAAVAVTAAKYAWGLPTLYYVIGLTGSALLAAAIPNGALQTTMRHEDPWSPLLMSAIATPIYSSPLPGMQKIGLMFDHGNSHGAAFILFILGIGTNLGLLLWMLLSFGFRFLVWLASVFVLVLGLAYGAESLLYPEGKRQEDHTHAFDDYTCPFSLGPPSNLPERVAKKVQEQFGPLEQYAVTALGLLAATSVLVRKWDREGQIERWLTTVPASHRSSWMNRKVPGPVLGICMILGLIIFSVAGAYVYYPPTEQALTELSQLRTEVIIGVRLGKSREAIRDLERMDDVTRRLEVGAIIRRFRYDPEAAKSSEELRQAIEELRDHLLADDVDAARARLNEFDTRYATCRDHFRRDS